MDADERVKAVLTDGLAGLHTAGLHAPGEAGPLVHQRRNAQHPVETAQLHGVTQLVCREETKSLIRRVPPRVPAIIVQTHGSLGSPPGQGKHGGRSPGTKPRLCCRADEA
jgi:hypothetical protein